MSRRRRGDPSRGRPADPPRRRRTDRHRGQSHVVGVALLLGVTVVSMGALTAAVGLVVDSSATEADAERVASDLEDALDPVVATGPRQGTVTFADGRLHPVERNLTVRRGNETLEIVRVDALVVESDDRRVAFHGGAVVRGRGDNSWLTTPPPITVGEEVLVVGTARLGDDVGSVSGRNGVTATVATNVSHHRRGLGTGNFSVAVETAGPTAWERHLASLGANVTRTDGDPPVVVGTFDGERTGYLVVHDLDAEVRGGG